jgi:crotonobetainyl-CoA:carnitine CoA-transferase CaiB-like acyl-CoA transferase
MGPLAGLRVVEIATEIAGPYCTKLLVDLGGEVTKIESPTGDPLRRWGRFPGGANPDHGGLFMYLNAGKRGATLDLSRTDDVATAGRLIADAHLLVEASAPGTLDRYGLDAERLEELRPGLVVVRISDFGQHGPLRDRVTTPLTMQAAAGWITARDPDRPPVQAGARISEYVAGGYAALGALAALRGRRTDSNDLVEVDVSVFESLLSSLPSPMLMAERARHLGLPGNMTRSPMLGIVRAADGWIGINCLTGQHWLDVCAMLGLPEYGEHQIAIMLGSPERAEFFEKAQPWLSERTVTEIVELSQAMRIPAAPVNDGETVLDCPQYRDRGFFVTAGDHARSFRRPGAPYRLSKTSPGGATTGDPFPAGATADPSSPFKGIKVLDFTTFWAGAYLTCYLGAFGAEIVKVESIQRPDGHRYSGAFPHEGERWYEHSALWQATNLNKCDITLDLGSQRGRELVRQLAAEADVVVENFSPRVIEQFGLDYESLAELNPNVIMVRMPGFGLRGPWRDYVGWALNIEQTSGMSAATGYADGPPCNLQGPADPIVGVHAGVALLAALEHRRRTGEGQLIEVAQIEVAACVAAEPVIEYSRTGVVPPREGNRRCGCLQGVYPTAAEDAWVAVCVRDRTDWANLVDAMERPELRDVPPPHDEFDRLLTEWTTTRPPADIVDALQARHVPGEQLLTPDRMYDVAQLDARGYYEEFEHPITGVHRYPGWPFRITPGPARHHRFGAPTLGQHNKEILTRLGVDDHDIAALREQRVIGEAALNA